MGIRKLKQKVAVALITAMSVSNVLSAAAATTGTPSRVDDVKVTFDGKGGTWPTNIASKSFASKSSAARVEEKERSKQIIRNYLVGASEKDDSGNYYISLSLSKGYVRGSDWMDVERDGYERVAWFDGDEYLTDDSKKNLYNGAVLEAVWQAKDTLPEVDSAIKDVLGKDPVIIAKGLGADQKLVLDPIPAEADKEYKAELEKVLLENDFSLVGDLENAVGIELSVQKNAQNVNMVGKKVEITLPVPKALSVEEDEKVEIKAIHFKENGKPEVFPVKLNDARTFMTLVAENGFSPFYFVKTKAAEKVNVKINNVENGYILAWTQEQKAGSWGTEKVYLPLNEEVALEAGTTVYLQPRGYGYATEYAEGWSGRLDSLEVVKAKDEREELKVKETIEPYYISYQQIEYIVKEDCTIQAEFSRWAPEPEEDSGNITGEHPEFNIWVDPNRNVGDRYSGRVFVEKWDDTIKDYKEIKGYKVRIATEKDLKDKFNANVAEFYKEKISKFTYENDVLYSKGKLDEDSYEIPFVITYEDKEYLAETEHRPYTAWVYWTDVVDKDDEVKPDDSTYFGLYLSLVRYDEKYNSNSYHGGNYLYSGRISVKKDATWKDVKGTLVERLEDNNAVPKMHNYPVLSWQDENGKEVKDGDKVESSNYYYTLFKNEDGKAYHVDAEYKKGPLSEDTCSITVKNVDNGAVIAYTKKGNEQIYIPLDEKVTLPVNTKIILEAQGYYGREDDKNWRGKLTALKLTSGKEEKNLINGERTYYEFWLNKDYTVEATFTKILQEEEYSKFELDAEAKDAAGKYSSKVEVSILSEDGSNEYKKLDPSEYKLRIANEDDFFKAGIDASRYDGKLFTYENDILTSNEELALDTYNVPFVITYKDQEVLYDEVNSDAYSAYISIGATNTFYHSAVKVGDQYESNGSDYIHQVRFAKDGKENWSTAEALLPSYKTPQMYGYKFVGWQNYKGEAYKADSALVSKYENSNHYNAFDMFVKEDDEKKPYEAPKATVDGNKPLEPENPDDSQKPDDTNKPGNNGGGSGGGGGSRRHVVGGGSSRNSYSMTGNWVLGANGVWTFTKSDGQKAVNTWGWINGQYYYFDANGNMVTGWQFINGQWYYLNPAEGSLQGAMVVGVIYDPVYNAYFYANPSGAMVTGWNQVNQKWYYFSPVNDGVHVTGALLSGTYVDGYYLGADGAWVSGN